MHSRRIAAKRSVFLCEFFCFLGDTFCLQCDTMCAIKQREHPCFVKRGCVKTASTLKADKHI